MTEEQAQVDFLLCYFILFSFHFLKLRLLFCFFFCSSKSFTTDPAQSLEAESLNNPFSIKPLSETWKEAFLCTFVDVIHFYGYIALFPMTTTSNNFQNFFFLSSILSLFSFIIISVVFLSFLFSCYLNRISSIFE